MESADQNDDEQALLTEERLKQMSRNVKSLVPCNGSDVTEDDIK